MSLPIGEVAVVLGHNRQFEETFISLEEIGWCKKIIPSFCVVVDLLDDPRSLNKLSSHNAKSTLRNGVGCIHRWRHRCHDTHFRSLT
jgi:hypothetical protein